MTLNTQMRDQTPAEIAARLDMHRDNRVT